MTRPGRGRCCRWPAGLALALLLSARPAAAVPIPLLDLGAAGFVGQAQQGPLDQPVEVQSYSQFVATFGSSTAGLANPYLAPSAAAFFANGGQHLWVVRTAGADDASLVGTDGGPGARTGLQSLLDVDSLGAVAISGATSPAVQAALIAHAEAMRYRLAVLDPVSATDPNVVTTQRSGLASADGYAALYFPWIVASPAGTSLTLPPSGFVAGILARTSPPDSPAGATAGAVLTATDVSYPVSSTLQNTLNPLGIDCIRTFTGQGVLLFGARTIATNTDWQYLAVRRAGFDLEKSVERGTAWCLQEPNDETLWAQLRTDVTDFLHARWLEGWFQGTTTTQAFFVRCDATTMTQADIAEGRTIILVGFAPITPAEFVIFRVVQQRPTSTGVAPDAAGFVLRAPAPNPARGGTTLSFDLPRAGAASLRVIDPSGRLVRTLVAGTLAAGRHEARWDGRDEAGTRAAPGLYFARLEIEGRVLARRIALAR